MTPTMSEYFEAWKNSHFVAGDKATEQAFVAASRLRRHRRHPRGNRLHLRGCAATGRGPEPRPGQSRPRRELRSLLEFASDLRDREADGEQFTAEQADAFGAEAQTQAEAIAGQVTQSAERLNVLLQEG